MNISSIPHFLLSLLLRSKTEPTIAPARAEIINRYSSDELHSGNDDESSDVVYTDQQRQAEIIRHKEDLMKRKRRRKKRTSSSIYTSSFYGESQLRPFADAHNFSLLRRNRAQNLAHFSF